MFKNNNVTVSEPVCTAVVHVRLGVGIITKRQEEERLCSCAFCNSFVSTERNSIRVLRMRKELQRSLSYRDYSL